MVSEGSGQLWGSAEAVPEVPLTTYTFADVPCQQQGSDDDEEGPDHEQHHSQCDGLVGDFWWALLELDGKTQILKS